MQPGKISCSKLIVKAAVSWSQLSSIKLKRLFESFIKLIATAIDKKSEYTGGHCERVPVITMMLADAVAVIGSMDLVFGEIDR